MIKIDSKIFIAGHKGMLGSSILRTLKKKGYKNLITAEKKILDLRNQALVKKFFKTKKLDAVIIAAATVGGIKANINYPANFINDNLQIQTNLISSSYENKIKKLILFGSSCIYPKNIKTKISEEMLLTGKLEDTNEPYAIAKIAGLKLCESYNKEYKTNYKCLMPCNSYGPNDNYDLKNSHFFAALIKKIYIAKKKKKKSIVIWGTGKVRRELIYVKDIADACIFFMNKKNTKSLINIGSGKDKTILEYAKILIKIFNIKLKIKFDKTKPDGVKRKLLNINLAKNYGWKAKTDLDKGILLTLKSLNYKI